MEHLEGGLRMSVDDDRVQKIINEAIAMATVAAVVTYAAGASATPGKP
jgi:hypothetical protein